MFWQLSVGYIMKILLMYLNFKQIYEKIDEIPIKEHKIVLSKLNLEHFTSNGKSCIKQ
jgi:hypothetical protein